MGEEFEARWGKKKKEKRGEKKKLESVLLLKEGDRVRKQNGERGQKKICQNMPHVEGVTVSGFSST